ncbi:putative bifunctional diguanylate cyclase/phosphodiesterase [Prosthecomicrobium sp. N25]|uniref:putative bifunctional diguanylate cyclase/phosphodiesterase n=1 Tax=Prosthecomicrobium sp. N25 TaxID=3129254 RepID=UPI003077EC4D
MTDSDWQVRLVGKNYAIAIAILAGISLASFLSIHASLVAQAVHVELGIRSSEQSQNFNRVQTATRALMSYVERPDTSDAQIRRLGRQLKERIEDFDRVNARIIEIIQTGDRSLWFSVPDSIRRVYFEEPYKLQDGLRAMSERSTVLATMEPGELRRAVVHWSLMDFTLSSGTTILKGFDGALEKIHAGSLEHVARVERIHIAITLLTLVVLGGEVLLIFGPMVRRLGAYNRAVAEARNELDRIAYSDPLTGTGNRARFTKALAVAIERVPQDGGFALILCDLDRFKAVNDAFGHQVGDRLLAEMCRRIQSVIEPTAMLARLGGDEFAILVPGMTEVDRLAGLIARIRAATSRTWNWNGSEIDVSSSVGGALCPLHSDDPDRLLAYADKALYAAKQPGPHHQVFDQTLRRESDEEATLLREFGRAFADREFEVHYQPKVRTADGSIVGLEALVRWRHPERGLLAPAAFLTALHRAGRSVDLTKVVLDLSLRDVESLRGHGLHVGPVAVNMPEAMLAGNLACSEILEALERHGISPDALSIEITEDVLMSRAAETIQASVKAISDLGIRVAFDDFGTGFASLSHLRDFTFDELKIDRSFVAEIGTNPMSEQIIRSIVSLGRSLGKAVVAEGVETEAQRRFLVGEGCLTAQGYLFAAPMPFEALTGWLTALRAPELRRVADRRPRPTASRLKHVP